MSLDTAPGTRALLALEDVAPDVLFECLPGTHHPLWPQVRADLMVAMQNLDFGSSDIDTEPPTRLSVWGELAQAMLPSRSDARSLGGRRPIVHLAGGNTLHRVGGRWRNWLFGDYLENYPEMSALLQWAPARPEPAFEPTRSLAPAVTRAAAYARLSRARRAPTFAPIGDLVREFARLLELPISAERVDAIIATAVYREASRPHVESQVLRVLDRVQPRVVLMEDAAYGAWSPLIARMKSRGIRVVEPQHGWIGPSHGAYNFGAAMARPALSVGLPDELLTFGEYWSSGIRVPFAKTAIGKPHLEAVAADLLPWHLRPAEILVASSVADPEGTSEFVVALAEALSDEWRVRFRPHPSERAALGDRYPNLLAHPRVEIDSQPDVYDSLRSARGVVGTASTVLFEAIALGCRVVVRESPAADYYVGDLLGPRYPGLDGIDRIAQVMRDAAAAPPEASVVESIWKPHAVENLRVWMDAALAVDRQG